MKFPLRRFLFALTLALATLVASAGQLAPQEDCECCPPGVHEMMCPSCKACFPLGLVVQPSRISLAVVQPVQASQRDLNPSNHTEDIWHPPKG